MLNKDMRNYPLDKYNPISIWAHFWDSGGIPDLFISFSFDFGEIREEFYCQTWSNPPVINYSGDTFIGI